MACAKLYSRKNGKGPRTYYVRYYLPGQRDKRRQFTIGNVSSRRAKEIAERIRAMVIQGVDPHKFAEEQARDKVENPRLRLNDVAESYLRHCSIINKLRTLDLKKYSYHLLIKNLGNRFIDEINREMIEGWMTSMKHTKISANMHFRSVRSMFYWAFSEELITVNPFANGKIKQFKVAESDPEGYFTLEEINLILEACNNFDPELWRLVFLALETGGRISELLTLKMKDIDLMKERLLFRGTFTKSGKNRFVPLRPSAAIEIKKWILKPNQQLFRWNDHKKPSKLFTNILRRLSLQTTECGKRTFHTLRHTYASHLLMSGHNIFIVSRWLGHSSISITEKHYGHLIPEMVKLKLPY